MRKILQLFAFVLLPAYFQAQSADAFLSRFFVTELDGSVFMRWTITAGNTCEDTYIERSSDGISFERIGLIGGICGSPYEPVTFEFTDTVPLVNQISYYRLLLGYFGYTSPRAIELTHYNKEGYFLGPNPFSDYTRLAFENEDNDEHRILVFDMKGLIVQQIVSGGNEFIIRKMDLGAGVYFFLVLKENSVAFSGKMIAL